MSADINIDQGERSRGNWALPITGNVADLGTGAAPAGEAVTGGDGAGWSDAADGGGMAGCSDAAGGGDGAAGGSDAAGGMGSAGGAAVPWPSAAEGTAIMATRISRASTAALRGVELAKHNLEARGRTFGISLLMVSEGCVPLSLLWAIDDRTCLSLARQSHGLGRRPIRW